MLTSRPRRPQPCSMRSCPAPRVDLAAASISAPASRCMNHRQESLISRSRTVNGSPAYDDPTRLIEPTDPAGWERVYEGTMLESVLVTQLSGDFPGPVLAMVSVPLYSADRQRILIPRGSRIVGSAQAVTGPRPGAPCRGLSPADTPGRPLYPVAVRRLEPDRRIRAPRRGQPPLLVDVSLPREPWGVISGLTAFNADPFRASARDQFQSGVGQGLGRSAERILDRFLNRLPTITIRAGHRLRIWLTSDVLIPTPTPQGVTP